MPVSLSHVSLSEAERVIDAALARAAEVGIAVAVVVGDGAGRRVAARRQDGSPHKAVDMAPRQAYTAAGMGAPTEVWDDATAANPGFGGAITSIPGFTPFGGGKPLLVDGRLAGAVGVSGGTVDQDVDIATVAQSGFAPT